MYSSSSKLWYVVVSNSLYLQAVLRFGMEGEDGNEYNPVREKTVVITRAHVEAMFFRFKNPIFPFCLFANSASYTKSPNSPDFTGFYWILADSTKIF